MRGAAYEAWVDSMRDMRDSAPDIRIIWDKSPVARKEHRCDCCGETITIGKRYESRGIVEDGAFRAEKLHRWAYQYPSGCPGRRERDLAELREQAAKDDVLFNPSPDLERLSGGERV